MSSGNPDDVLAGAGRRVIVLDGDSRASLAVARSLDRAGYSVGVAASRRDALTFQSRCAAEILLLPSPLEAPEAYADLVMERARRGDVAAMIPCSEESLSALLPRLDLLREMTVVVAASGPVLEIVHDEINMNAVAARAGVPVPGQAMIELQKPLPAIGSFPVLLKPGRKIVRAGPPAGARGGVRVASRVIRNLDELATRVRNMPPDAFPCFAQAIMTGELEEYAALCRGGEPVVEFAQSPIRDLPPAGGMNVPYEAVRPNERIAESARRLLKELNFDGPVLLKFKRDEPGGEPTLVAAGGSFWPTLQLAIDAGVDFPALALQVARGGKIAVPSDVRYGFRTRWLLGDLEHLVWYLLRGRRVLRFSELAPSRMEAVARFFRDFKDPAMRLEVKSTDDPKPYRVMRKRYALQLLRMARRGLLAGFGLGLNRFRGLILTVENDPGDFPSAVRELAERLEKRKLHFACLALRAKDKTQEDLDRIVAHCARESSEHFLIIPGLFYDNDGGFRILALGADRVFHSATAKSLARSIRESGGVAIWSGFHPGEPANQPELINELCGVEIWNLTRDGVLSPPVPPLEEYARELERSPYLVAYQTASLTSTDDRPGRGHITIQADRLTTIAVLSALETGLFHLVGRVFRARSDHLSFLLVRLYASMVDRLFRISPKTGGGVK